jgi:ABC-type multidrug transport system fused ATPase/permease subunit
LKFSNTLLHSLRTNLERKDQKKGIWIITLMVINAMLDFFSVAAFLPLLAFIINPAFISTNPYAKGLYDLFSFSSHSIFVVSTTIAVLMFVLIKNLGSLWIANIKARFAFGIRNDLSSRELLRYLQSNYFEFTKVDFSSALNKIVHYPLAFANYIILSLATIISESLVVIFILACVLYYDYKVLIVVILILLPTVAILKFRKKKLDKISSEIKTMYPTVLKYANQTIEGFVEINAYQKTRYFTARFEILNKKISEIFIRDQTVHAGTLRLSEIMIAFILCSLIIYSVLVQLHYQQTLALLGIYAGASFRIIPSINRILHALQQMRTNKHVVEALKISVQHKPVAVAQPAAMRFTDTLELKNISIGYPERPQTLSQLSLSIRKGEKIAITGASGEGKTTLLLVLFGFLQPERGEVLVDGKPVQDLHAWQRLIGYVPQNPYLLDGTIAENIAFGVPPETIDVEKIQKIIDKLGLKTLVQQLKNGIHTLIGERGVELSGGQRQRLALARALYANVKILLLDEVTNQVEGKLESEIMDLLQDLSGEGVTIIMVTHRAKDNFFDAILELKNQKLHRFLPNESLMR